MSGFPRNPEISSHGLGTATNTVHENRRCIQALGSTLPRYQISAQRRSSQAEQITIFSSHPSIPYQEKWAHAFTVVPLAVVMCQFVATWWPHGQVPLARDPTVVAKNTAATHTHTYTPSEVVTLGLASLKLFLDDSRLTISKRERGARARAVARTDRTLSVGDQCDQKVIGRC